MEVMSVDKCKHHTLDPLLRGQPKGGQSSEVGCVGVMFVTVATAALHTLKSCTCCSSGWGFAELTTAFSVNCV